MNHKLIAKTIGVILCVDAGCMIPSLLVALVGGERDIQAFLITILLCIVPGIPLARLQLGQESKMQLRDGFATVAMCWFFISLFGAFPYWFSGVIPNFIDAFFESVSGFTTTGASILSDVESMPKGLLIWRCCTQFMGGMGVLVLMLALLPKLGAGSSYLMQAESPGPIKTKLVPKIGQSAKILYGLYLILTGIEVLCLRLAGMDWYDSICHAMTTMSSGGFSTKNTSIAYFQSGLIDWIIILFMFLASLSFSMIYRTIRQDINAPKKNGEFKFYSGVVAIAIVLIALALAARGELPFPQGITDTVFQVVSVVSSTGYATADFNLWPTFCQAILLFLMVMGGCAGSTSGGVKSIRILLLLKTLRRALSKILHPRRVNVICQDGQRVDEATLSSVAVFFFAYCALLILGTIVVSLDNMGFTTAFSAVLSALSNIGPGLDVVGPMGNYSSLSLLSKLVLGFCMLAGRLEILPILLLLSPSSWTQK